jgi:hypothetical protein
MDRHGPVTIMAAGITIGGVRPQFTRTDAITSRRKATRDSGGAGHLRRAPRLGEPAGHPPRPAQAGHTSAVLAGLERRLGAKGCRKVNLLIEPESEPGSGFYRQHGYTEDQLIFMEKWLHPEVPTPE